MSKNKRLISGNFITPSSLYPSVFFLPQLNIDPFLCRKTVENIEIATWVMSFKFGISNGVFILNLSVQHP